MFKVSVLLFFLCAMSCAWAEKNVLTANYFIRYTAKGTSSVEKYWISLLELALRKNGQPFTMQAYDKHLTHDSLISALASNRPFLTVLYMGTSKQVEARLMPVRIPLYRGLNGFRIFIIHRDQQEKFSKISRLDDFFPYRFGLGHGWPDIKMYQDAGFHVIEAKYNNLFKLVNSGRIDLFSRSINEVFSELNTAKNEFSDLVAERDLLLYYRQASFFFVSKSNKVLHDALYNGLVKAYEDGSFMEHFNNHPAVTSIFKKASLEKRRRFMIENTTLSEQTRDIPDQYWHQIK